jgi:transcriptional regulator of acetoin/glycerol metabolism
MTPESERKERYLVVRGKNTSLRIALPDLGRVTVGRSASNDVVLEEPGVADAHLVLYVDRGIEAEILASDAGVNGDSYTEGQSTEIRPGDQLRIGTAELEIAVRSGERAAHRIFTRRWFESRLVEEAERDGEHAVIGIDAGQAATAESVEAALSSALRLGEIAGAIDERECAVLTSGPASAAESRAAELASEIGRAIGAPVAAGFATSDERRGAALLEIARGRLTPAETSPAATAREPPVAEDASMKEVLRAATAAADGEEHILILGETGTGKDLLARWIHELSPRRDRPLVRVNSVDLDDALTEAAKAVQRARGGTVLFDEIAGLSPRAQLALGRFLERTQGTRFIFTSNHDLRTEAQSGAFRKDLFFRIHKTAIEIPPLRARKRDIVALAKHILVGLSLSPAAEDVLVDYGWPGNVRELEAVLARAVRSCTQGPIEPAHLPHELFLEPLRDPEETIDRAESEVEAEATPPTGRPSGSLRDEMLALERQRILEALERYGTQTEAAKALDIPIRTFLNRLDALGIKRVRKSKPGTKGE